MKRWIPILAVMILGMPCAARAETVYLNDGRVVKGPIVDESSYYVVIKEGGMPRRYYREQILRIEKDDDFVYELGDLNIDPTQFKDISERKVKLIITLMEVNGTHRNMENNIEQIIAQAPPEQAEKLQKLFNVSDIITQLIPLYDKHYTQNELKEIIAFYRSPAGQKVIKATPEIMKEALQVSVDYFRKRANP